MLSAFHVSGTEKPFMYINSFNPHLYPTRYVQLFFIQIRKLNYSLWNFPSVTQLRSDKKGSNSLSLAWFSFTLLATMSHHTWVFLLLAGVFQVISCKKANYFKQAEPMDWIKHKGKDWWNCRRKYVLAQICDFPKIGLTRPASQNANWIFQKHFLNVHKASSK